MQTYEKSYSIVILQTPNNGEALRQPEIVGIVRTYECRTRAGEDIDLLRQYAPTSMTFEIVESEHIA